MATVSVPAQRTPKLRGKYAIFAFVLVMMLIVANANERFLIDRTHPYWVHIDSFKYWLLVHGLAGATALFLGPFQFSDRLRLKYTKLHRVAGRFYVGGVMIAAPLGFYIQYIQPFIPGWVPLASVDAALWMSTTGLALYFAMKRDIETHRRWMTRSYAVALVFLEGRALNWLFPRFDVISAVWLSLVLAVPLADLVLQIEDWLRKRRSDELRKAALAGR